MGYFYTKGRFKQFNERRLFFLVIAGIAYVITETGRFYLRSLAREGNFNDFGLTDSIGNWGGVVVQIFFMMTLNNPTRAQSYRIVAFVSVGYIVYEFLQPVLPRGTFDWNDVYGTLVGACFCTIILLIMWKLAPPEKTAKPSVQDSDSTP